MVSICTCSAFLYIWDVIHAHYVWKMHHMHVLMSPASTKGSDDEISLELSFPYPMRAKIICLNFRALLCLAWW